MDVIFFAKNLSAEDYDKLMTINNTLITDVNAPRRFADYQHLIKGFGRELIYFVNDPV